MFDFVDDRRAGFLVFEMLATGQNPRTVGTTDDDLDLVRQRRIHQALQGTITVYQSVAKVLTEPGTEAQA